MSRPRSSRLLTMPAGPRRSLALAASTLAVMDAIASIACTSEPENHGGLFGDRPVAERADAGGEGGRDAEPPDATADVATDARDASEDG